MVVGLAMGAFSAMREQADIITPGRFALVKPSGVDNRPVASQRVVPAKAGTHSLCPLNRSEVGGDGASTDTTEGMGPRLRGDDTEYAASI